VNEPPPLYSIPGSAWFPVHYKESLGFRAGTRKFVRERPRPADRTRRPSSRFATTGAAWRRGDPYEVTARQEGRAVRFWSRPVESAAAEGLRSPLTTGLFFLTVTDFGGLNESSPLAGEDRPRSGQMRGTTREATVGIRGSPSRKPWTSMAFWLASPSSGPSGHLPPRGGKAVDPTSSPLAGEDRRRRRQMRGTTRQTTVGIRGSPSRRPWTSMAFWLASPSSGPSGHLPPRGGKAVDPTSSPLAGEDRRRRRQMRGTTRQTTVGIRGSPSRRPWTSMAFWLAPPHPALRATFPREGGRPSCPPPPKSVTVSPFQGLCRSSPSPSRQDYSWDS